MRRVPGDPLARSLARVVHKRVDAADPLLQRVISFPGGQVLDATNWAAKEDRLAGMVSTHCATARIFDSRTIEAVLDEIKAWAHEPATRPYANPQQLLAAALASVEARHAAAAAAAAQAQAQVRAPLTLEGGQRQYGYLLVAAPEAKIRDVEAEKDFLKTYLPSTMTLEEAVDEAIDSYALSRLEKPKYTRHDFQPARAGVENIQVQLGGATNFRVGKGDTSSTLVLIDTAVWDAIPDGDRRELLALAHRRSFANRERIELRVPPKPAAAETKKKPALRRK